MNIDDMLFVGFNGRIAALDPSNGQIVWDWKAPQGSGFVTVLLDRGMLFASVNGYTYAIDPRNGAQLWMNPMKGFGFGVTSLATTRSGSSDSAIGQAEVEESRRRSSHHHHGG